MNFINSKQDKHLTQIVNILSMYQTLLITQIEKLYPELSKEKLLLLIRRLEKSGRLIYIEETDLFSSEDLGVAQDKWGYAFGFVLYHGF